MIDIIDDDSEDLTGKGTVRTVLGGWPMRCMGGPLYGWPVNECGSCSNRLIPMPASADQG